MALEAFIERIDPNEYIDALSKRVDLTWDIIQKYEDVEWPIEALSRLAPLDYIEQHPDKPWNYYKISDRQDLTIDFIKIFKDKLDWECISANVDFQDVLDNPELSWNYQALSYNNKIKSDDILENPHYEWDYSNLSSIIDVNFVYANPDLPWDYSSLSDRINLDFIRQNPDKSWNYGILSRNPNLTIDFILEHRSKLWWWLALYQNTNIDLNDLITHNLHTHNTFAFQYTYLEYCIENLPNVNWIEASQNAPFDLIDKYPDKPWITNQFSENINITMNYVLEHPELDWNYMDLSNMNKITLQDVLDHWDLPWDINSVIEFKY